MTENLLDQWQVIKNRMNLRNPIAQRLSILRYQTLLGKALCEQVEAPSFPSRFVILRFPTANSSDLCGLLNQHPEILCHEDVFDPSRIHYSQDFHKLQGTELPLSRYALIRGQIGPATLAERNCSPERFCINLWQNSCNAKAVGFSLLPNHVPNMATALVRDKGVKKVLLVHHNKLEAYLHWRVTRQIPFWDAANTNASDLPRIAVSPHELLLWSYQHDRYFNQLRNELTKRGQSYLEIAYEDLYDANNELLKARLLKFIGVSLNLKHLSYPVEKPSYGHLPVLVKNFYQIREQLQGSPLGALLLERA